MTGRIRQDMLHSRQVALDLMNDVLVRRQALDHALERHEELAALPVRDRAFVRMMVATALRRCGQLDDLIRRASQRPDTQAPLALINILRLGGVQILFMDVPDYAAVDTAVGLAEQAGLARQKGYVNAVLRRMTETGRDILAQQDAARLNTPEWLMKLWIADYGLRTAAEIAQAHLTEAPLDISIKDMNELSHWAQRLEAAILPTGTLRRAAGGMVQSLPGYEDGMWWVQDAAAALPVTLLGDVAGQDVLDLCAAPGGKTMQLLARGAQVTALDRSVQRLKILKENLARLRLTGHIRTEVADAAVWRPKEPASHILLDAPCTATGTARRHPDMLHLKTEKDLQSLIAVQERLLESAADMLAPGGVLVYCTCSLQKDEGERQIERVLQKRRKLQRVPVTPAEIGRIEGAITPEGDVRILPFHLATHGGMDGFYMARLQKIS